MLGKVTILTLSRNLLNASSNRLMFKYIKFKTTYIAI